MKQIPGLTEVRDYLATVAVVDDRIDGKAIASNRELVETYRHDHARRLWRSLQLIGEMCPATDRLRILELGAAPYFFSALLLGYLDCSVVGVNVRAGVWPGAAGETAERSFIRLRHGRGRRQRTDELEVMVLNVEKDPYPFDDGSFDLVLCMETIEHLAYSPTFMLAESARVSAPGGQLLVSTPNAVDMHRTLRMLANLSIGFAYSGYGVYGRHNREFTAPELARLVSACGFRVRRVLQENPYRAWRAWPPRQLVAGLLARSTGLPLPYLRAKREYLFVLAEKADQPTLAYPEDLYVFRNLYPTSVHRDG